jgi:putative transcription factor
VCGQLRCEVCGSKINGKPFNVIIEGAKLTVCHECAKLGKICYAEPKPKTAVSKPKLAPLPLRVQTRRSQAPTVDTSLELVEGFDARIRQARESLGISHEELGRRINEKVSLLRKIETGKMKPDNRLATLLERTLRIKLIVPAKEDKVPPSRLAKTSSRELTLGDLIQLDKEGREKEGTAGRRQS